jgi:hypothetical protein
LLPKIAVILADFSVFLSIEEESFSIALNRSDIDFFLQSNSFGAIKPIFFQKRQGNRQSCEKKVIKKEKKIIKTDKSP